MDLKLKTDDNKYENAQGLIVNGCPKKLVVNKRLFAKGPEECKNVPGSSSNPSYTAEIARNVCNIDSKYDTNIVERMREAASRMDALDKVDRIFQKIEYWN